MADIKGMYGRMGQEMYLDLSNPILGEVHGWVMTRTSQVGLQFKPTANPITHGWGMKFTTVEGDRTYSWSLNLSEVRLAGTRSFTYPDGLVEVENIDFVRINKLPWT